MFLPSPLRSSEVKRQLKPVQHSTEEADDAVGTKKIEHSLCSDETRNELSRHQWSQFVTFVRWRHFCDILSSNEGRILVLFWFYTIAGQHGVTLYFCFQVDIFNRIEDCVTWLYSQSRNRMISAYFKGQVCCHRLLASIEERFGFFPNSLFLFPFWFFLLFFAIAIKQNPRISQVVLFPLSTRYFLKAYVT